MKRWEGTTWMMSPARMYSLTSLDELLEAGPGEIARRHLDLRRLDERRRGKFAGLLQQREELASSAAALRHSAASAAPAAGGTWALTHRRRVCFARSKISSVSDSMK